DAIATIARHPLARAMRADKLTLALLQEVASTYLSGRGASIPLWRMATTPVQALRGRADTIAAAIPGAKVVDAESVPGGGALPGLTIPSVAVAVEPDDVEALHAALRAADIVARVDDGLLLCDLRSVAPDDDRLLAEALRTACA